MEKLKLDRPFLVGDKVYLRPLDISDVNAEYLNWINDEDVINNLATVFPTSFLELENYVKSAIASPNYVFFAIMEKHSGVHIGNVKLGPINWIDRTTNYGLMLGDKNSWGKGYAQESFQLLIKFAFEKLNLHKIWDMAVMSNIASIKANQKAGFSIEGELKKHSFKDGEYKDIVILSLLAEDYFAGKEKN